MERVCCGVQPLIREQSIILGLFCQIISAEGKETLENKPQPHAARIGDTSVPPCKPGTRLTFTLAVQTLYFSGVYQGEVSRWVPSPWLVASPQREQWLQLCHHCTAPWFSFLITRALAPAALSSSSSCPKPL